MTWWDNFGLDLFIEHQVAKRSDANQYLGFLELIVLTEVEDEHHRLCMAGWMEHLSSIKN